MQTGNSEIPADNLQQVAAAAELITEKEQTKERENPFADNPPNASVSIMGAKGEVTAAVLLLSQRPRMSGNDMVFPIKVLDGELPNAGETVIMFIDSIGRPASPTSIAGAHRRQGKISCKDLVRDVVSKSTKSWIQAGFGAV